MTQISRIKPVLISTATILVGAAAGVLLWTQSARAPLSETTKSIAPKADIGAPPALSDPAMDTQESQISGTTRRLVGPQETAASPEPDGPGADKPEIVPHDVALASYKADLWEEIQANPPSPRELNDPEVDAELAYKFYTWYGNCSVIPRTQRQVDQRLEHVARNLEHASGSRLQGMEGRVEQILSNYELCYSIPREVDCRLEAVHWLTRAVQLGHDIAEIQFYEKAMGFILRPDRLTQDPPLAMKQPGLVVEFKDTARLGLVRALEKGHPEAYLANSQALLEGLIYKKDPLEAFAYARAAELLAARNHLILESLEYWKNAALQFLTEDQLREAEKRALALQTEDRG